MATCFCRSKGDGLLSVSTSKLGAPRAQAPHLLCISGSQHKAWHTIGTYKMG